MLTNLAVDDKELTYAIVQCLYDINVHELNCVGIYRGNSL